MLPIYLRNVPPPVETVDHVGLLTWFAKWIRPERYLELGVETGRCFVEIAKHSTQAIAVDIAPNWFAVPENAVYEQMSTDDYFRKIAGTDIMFDMVFIDADHSFEQSYKDFLNVKDFVIPDGFVFFHDTYPCNEALLVPRHCNDAYKTAIKIRETFHNEWELVTLPFSPGVTIAKKIYNKTLLPWMVQQ